MYWMVTIGAFLLHQSAWLAGLLVFFRLLARSKPCNPGMHWWKDLRAVATDFVYWFIVPYFVRIGQQVMLIVGMLLLYGGTHHEFSRVRALPLLLQCGAILVIQDVLLYWIHRIFHTRLGWHFHAIHHSPKVLDWMSAARFHPLNNLLAFGLADVAVLLMGFSPVALVVLTPFNILHGALVHANLDWTFGPFRYVLASPVFHRWHHTTEAAGLDKNFAPTFPVLDVIFGTFYMPVGERPARFGNGVRDFPEDFLGQLLHPFRRMARRRAGPIEWAQQRPIATALIAATGLAVAGLLGLRVYFAALPHGGRTGEVRAVAVGEGPRGLGGSLTRPGR